MQPNPTLRRLGLSDSDRVVILHTDDIGMCQASVQAFSDLYACGGISSGSVMVPCPWFLEAAKFARFNPGADLGVHMTLTSEWQTYRWGPISTRDPRSGMLDAQGCFYHGTAQAVEHGEPAAVQAEMLAQVDMACAAGMQPTHADTHMGVSITPKYIAGYLKLALEKHLPPLVFRYDEERFRAFGYDTAMSARVARLFQAMEALGLPVFDQVGFMPLDQAESQMEYAKQALSQLPAGVTHFLMHPSVDTPELRAIAPDWRGRVANYTTFMSAEIREFIRASGIQVIGYRALQQIMPADPAEALSVLEQFSADSDG